MALLEKGRALRPPVNGNALAFMKKRQGIFKFGENSLAETLNDAARH
jgi:hypothetical protein